ncbi:hypothetical protein [Tellurirhabdus bombi]|uniref:hypothetical protein n=1 Tax=Tellurirhabdus bombi TaxID=2907205 RepID=UPI001F2F83FD|nr:hypothetical protein [Tellurirhabdus bombi]
MSKNINLGGSRIAMAAINLTLGNRKKFQNHGTLQALRSPQVAALIAEMNPINAKNQNRLSIIQGQATPQARVQLNYRPQVEASVDTSRTVATGANPVGATSLNVDYNLHREFKLTYRTVDLLALEAEAEKYLEQVNAGSLSVNMPGFQLLSDMGDQTMRKIDSVFASSNTAALNAVIGAVGGNKLIGNTAPDNAAVPNVKGFKADGSIHLDLHDWFANLQTVHSFEGKPIVIGGLKALNWFNRKGIVSAASLGYDYAKAYDLLDVEFYYDPLVDTLSGQDHIIVLDPGAACLETIMEHQSIISLPKVANTTYGTVSVSVAQTGAPTFTLDMDLRVREDDSTAYPSWTITPSMKFGVFTRPAGFHKGYDGWDTVTGIFRAKITNAT